MTHPHEQLIARLQASHPADAAIAAGLAQLRQGTDAALALTLVRACVAAGIAGVAARIIDAMPEAIRTADEMIALRTQVVEMPTGRSDTGQQEVAAREAVAALVGCRPHLESIADALVSRTLSLTAYQTRSGQAFVFDDTAARSLACLYGVGDETALRQSIDQLRADRVSSVLIKGQVQWDIVRRLWALQTEREYQPPIECVLPSLERCAAWLIACPNMELLRSDRLGVFIGRNARDQIERFLANRLDRATPNMVITGDLSEQEPTALADLTPQSLGRAQSRRCAALFEQQCAVHKERSMHQPGDRLRVCGITTRRSTVMQYAMRDLGRAFERRGCSFELLIEPHAWSANVNIWSALAERRCDLVVVINHVRDEFSDRICPDVPYVCWIQDYMDHLWSKRVGATITPSDLVVGRGKGVLTSMYGYPDERFIATTNLSDQAVYHDTPVDERTRKRYACDVSFVSHGGLPVDAIIDEVRALHGDTAGDACRRYVQSLHERLAGATYVLLGDKLRLFERDARQWIQQGADVVYHRRVFMPLIDRIYDRLLRHQAISWAADWADRTGRTLRLYGKGWEEHPRLRSYAHDPIEPGEPLRAVYQASSLTLQVNGYGSLHQRLMDAVLSGGCVLSRFNQNDFYRGHLLAIQEQINRRNITSLEELLALRTTDGDLDRDVTSFEHMLGIVVDFAAGTSRAADNALLGRWGIVPDWYLTDEGLFADLKHLRLSPDTVAGEMPGFEQTVFTSRESLEQLLDSLVDAPASRQQLMSPLLANVAEQHTYDGLIDRIVDHFDLDAFGSTHPQTKCAAAGA